MTNQLKLNTLILVISVLIALLASKILIGDRFGLDFVILYTVSVAIVIAFRQTLGKKLSPLNGYLLSSASVFCLCLIWRNSPTLYALNLFAIMLIAIMSYSSLITEKRSNIPLTIWLKFPGKLIANFIFSPIHLVRSSLLAHSLNIGLTSQVRSALFGVLWALPVLIIFGSLLVGADTRYEKFIESFFSLDLSSLFSIIFETLFYWPLTAAFFLLTLAQDTKQKAAKESSIAKKMSMNGIQISIILGTLNLLFISYIAIQSTYFFGGDLLVINTEGATYSSYARKGFWELVWVAIFSLLLLLTTDWLVRDESIKLKKLIKHLSYLLIFMIVIVECSAAHRMFLYIKAYGLTELRFYSSVFMVFIITALILFSYALLKGQRNAFIYTLLCTALGFVFALNIANPNAIIASHNLSNPNTDPDYITLLGLDATSTITHLTRYKSDDLQCTLRHNIRLELNNNREWYQWSYSVYQAKKIINTWQPNCH